MEDEKLFEFMTKMYSEMQEGFKQVNNKIDKVDGRIDKVDGRIDKIDGRIDKLEKTVFKMEQEHGQKLDALFDGYKQNSEQLNRIEHEVAKDEEVVLRKIK